MSSSLLYDYLLRFFSWLIFDHVLFLWHKQISHICYLFLKLNKKLFFSASPNSDLFLVYLSYSPKNIFYLKTSLRCSLLPPRPAFRSVTFTLGTSSRHQANYFNSLDSFSTFVTKDSNSHIIRLWVVLYEIIDSALTNDKHYHGFFTLYSKRWE